MEFPPRPSDLPLIAARHTGAIRRGLCRWSRAASPPPALGDRRWPAELILSTWLQAETGAPAALAPTTGDSGGGFDRLVLRELPASEWLPEVQPIDLAIPLNRRAWDPRIEISVPWYGAGMSFGR